DGAGERAVRLRRPDVSRIPWRPQRSRRGHDRARRDARRCPGSRGRVGAAAPAVFRESVDTLALMLSPFAPHMCEELWEHLGHTGGLAAARWPSFDAEAAKADAIVGPVQVNGKLRGRITVAPDAP